MKIVPAFLIFILLLSSCKKMTIDGELCLDTIFSQAILSESLQAVFFLNGKDGFVSGYNGGIYKTTDSAKNWIQQNSTTTLPIHDLFFVDAMQGFAVGGQNTCGGTGCTIPGGFILKTIDGGNTWMKVYTPLNKIEISSIYFITTSIGFFVGDNVIIKTTDGGQTWSEHKIDNLGGTMMQVKFVNQQTGYIVCAFDKLVKTEDGGLTWQVTSPQPIRGYLSISEANGSIYVSGQGKMMKSTNGGDSWTELSNTPYNIYFIHFISDSKGFAFGAGNYSGGDFGHNYGSIYCTINGGITWNGSADIKEVGPIRAVSFPANNLAYAVSGNKIIRLIAK